MSTNQPIYEGSCLCGKIEIQVIGEHLAAGYCHCEDCRTWHAAPVNAWATWPNEKISVIHGQNLIVEHEKGANLRCRCENCGSGLMNRKPNNLTVVYAAVLAGSGYVHQANFHIHCDESILDLPDGLPKYVDVPKEWGGTGETLPEPEQVGMRPAIG